MSALAALAAIIFFAREVMFGGVGVALTVDGCISALVDLDYVFSLREDGAVTVKQPAKRNPRAAEMMAYLALHKEEVRAAVHARQAFQTEIPVEPPDAVGDMDALPSAAQDDQRVINETLDKPCGVDQILAANGTGEVHDLVGMNATEASSLIEFIREGRGELIGQFVYHKSTGLFDARVRFLEGWAD